LCSEVWDCGEKWKHGFLSSALLSVWRDVWGAGMIVGVWGEGKEINWYMWMQCLEKQYWIDCLVRNGTCTNTILSAVLQAGLGMRVRKWSGKEALSLVSPDPHWEHSCGESNLKDKLVLLVIPYHHCVCVCACVGRGVVPVIYSQCLSLAVQILGGLGTRLGGQQLHWSSWVPLTSVQWPLIVFRSRIINFTTAFSEVSKEWRIQIFSLWTQTTKPLTSSQKFISCVLFLPFTRRGRRYGSMWTLSWMV